MNLNDAEVQEFYDRIDRLPSDREPRFGKMNAGQMVSHCADFFRMAKGLKRAEAYGVMDPEDVKKRARSQQSVPTPKGFGQAEGDGTPPADFQSDKNTLKAFIHDFASLDPGYVFAEHPIFGDMSTRQWVELARWHLNHHLSQFGV